LTQSNLTKLLAALAGSASLIVLGPMAHAGDWTGSGSTDTTAKQDGVCPDEASVTVKLGGKCAGQLDSIDFETLDTPPKTIARGVSLGVKAHTSPTAGELKLVITGKLPTDLDTWSSKGVKAEAEDVEINHWTKGHETGFQEEFKGAILVEAVQDSTKAETGKKGTTVGAEPKTKQEYTLHFRYADLDETDLSGTGKTVTAADACSDKTPVVLLYIGGKCDGPVTDIHFTTFDKPSKTYARGSSLSDKQGKTGELSIVIDGALPTNIDTWSKKGTSAESEDIVIKHKTDDGKGNYEDTFSSVVLKEQSATTVNAKTGVPETTLHFSFTTLTDKAITGGTTAAWGN
jgi:hypothetical protein